MGQKYHQRFGINIAETEAKRRFVNRFHNLIQSFTAMAWNSTHLDQTQMERHVCYKLGEQWTGPGCLQDVIGNDFDKCLIALEGLYDHSLWKGYAAKGIKNLLAESEVDIGIRWENGQFLPSGAPLLDSTLVTDPLNLLGAPEHKGVSDAFKKGLDHLLHSKRDPARLADVITGMYDALEALSKIVCGNDKGINANRDAFISKLGLHASYNKMLDEYIDNANLIARHAGEKGQAKPLPSRREVESFMYLTRLFIRVTLSKD